MVAWEEVYSATVKVDAFYIANTNLSTGKKVKLT